MAAPPRPLGDDIEDAQGSNGGGNTTLSLVRRRSRGRRSRRVGPCGALLLMSTLVQRSMGAGSFFKGSNRGNTAPARPPASSNQRNENGNAHLAPPGEDRGGRGAALSPTMYTRVSRSPADAVGQAAAGRDRAAGAAAQQAGGGAGSLKGRHLAGMGGSANNPQRQERPPGFRSGRTTAGMTSAGGSSSIGGGGDSGGEEQAHQPSSDPRNSHIAKSLLERNNRATQPRRTTGTIATTRGDGASTWRGAGGGGGVGQGHTYAAVVSPPETVRREAFLAAGRTPSGRRAALEPRAGAGGEAGGGGGGPAAFDPYRNQQGQQQGQGFSGQGTHGVRGMSLPLGTADKKGPAAENAAPGAGVSEEVPTSAHPDPRASGGHPARVFEPVPEGRVRRRFLYFRDSRLQGTQPLRVRGPDDGSSESSVDGASGGPLRGQPGVHVPLACAVRHQQAKGQDEDHAHRQRRVRGDVAVVQHAADARRLVRARAAGGVHQPHAHQRPLHVALLHLRQGEMGGGRRVLISGWTRPLSAAECAGWSVHSASRPCRTSTFWAKPVVCSCPGQKAVCIEFGAWYLV